MRDEFDPILTEVLRLIVQVNTVSASFLQRKLSIGYSRAARILEKLEELGAISTAEGSQPRTVLVTSIEDLLLKIKEDAYRNFNNTTDDIETKNTLFNYAILPDTSEFKKLAVSNKIENKAFEILCGMSEGKAIFRNIDILQNIILAGASNSGKEKFLDQIIFSLLFEKSALDTKFLCIDYTRELDLYNKIPQMLTPNIFSVDKFESAIKWLHGEISRRQKLLSDAGTRSMLVYNKKQDVALPNIFVIIRNIEYFVSSKEYKEYLRDVVSLANKYGIHFILVTDTLSTSTIPSNIQVNIPTIINFIKPEAEGDFIIKTLFKEDRLKLIKVAEEEIKKLYPFMEMN